MKYNKKYIGIIKKALCMDIKSDTDLKKKAKIIYKELGLVNSPLRDISEDFTYIHKGKCTHCENVLKGSYDPHGRCSCYFLCKCTKEEKEYCGCENENY